MNHSCEMDSRVLFEVIVFAHRSTEVIDVFAGLVCVNPITSFAVLYFVLHLSGLTYSCAYSMRLCVLAPRFF